MTLPPEQRAEIAARLEAATKNTAPESWEVAGLTVVAGVKIMCHASREDYATFIAHAPTDIAALLAHVESDRARIAVLEEALSCEREACAKICDDADRQDDRDNGYSATGGAAVAARNIRARTALTPTVSG